MLNAQAQLDVIAQNLANASTTGFKRDGIAFNEALMRTMADFGGNGRSLGEMGAVQAMNVKYTDMEQGTLQVTGNPLDVAIQEEGMFAVQTDQGVRYTRAGSFTLDNTGRLVTQTGQPVLDNRLRPIGPLTGEVLITEAGEVQSEGQAIAQLGVFRGSFSKVSDNNYQSADAAPVATPRLASGAVEGSNVQAVEEMIAMIRTQRVFEMAQRSVTGQEDMTGRLLQILNSR